MEIVDPYNIPMLKGMKDTFVDVKATLDNHTTVIIEMQVLNVEAFEKRVLYNAGTMNMIPDNMNSEIEQAFNIINEAGLSEEELEAQHKRHDFIWLQKASIQKATKDGLSLGIKQGREQGREEGRKQGREEGREQGIEQMIVEMKSNEIPIATIAKITKLTEKEIREV